MNRSLAEAVGRLLFLPTLVIAVAILVKGYSHVGDGFSAGVIAALGPLVQLVAAGRPTPATAVSDQPSPVSVARFAPLIAYSGLWLTLAVSFAPLLFGETPLTHMPLAGQEVNHLGSIAFHTALLFDVGIFLVIFGFITTVAHSLRQKGSNSSPGQKKE